MNNKEEFDTATIENLKAYVYALVDPRNGKIFYVGKGRGNRVFDHVRDAIAKYKDDAVDKKKMSMKVRTIRQIIADGLEVKYYILKHGMANREALRVESALIDLLTYPDFKDKTVLTNIAAGHHQYMFGIKTVDDIKAIYHSKPIDEVLNPTDKLLIVKLNRSFKGDDLSFYEKTRGTWVLAERNAKQADYVLAVYNGVVRAVFKPKKWLPVPVQEGKRQRWEFVGDEVTDSPYLYTEVSEYAKGQNPIAYINYAPKK
jgi:hypothetical protein